MENKDLTPIEQIREMYESGQLMKKPEDNNSSLLTKLDEEFNDFIKDDEEVQEEVKKHNKKTFKLFTKRKETLNKDATATDIYQARYDRETWFYKRHKDTVDKYIKKDDNVREKKNKDDKIVYVENNTENILRIGLFKMLMIVWFDLFLDAVGKAVFFPIHLLRYVSELFFKMKKSIAITVIIIVAIIVVTVGLVFGINAIMDLARATR